jgi:hypothetical protein
MIMKIEDHPNSARSHRGDWARCDPCDLCEVEKAGYFYVCRLSAKNILYEMIAH